MKSSGRPLGECRFKGQGYYFGQPEDAAAVRRRLNQVGLLVDPSQTSTAPVSADKDSAVARRA
ncbi:MAG: hypothetical protein R3E18_02185 [Sphingomonadaceae bacterium]